ncbi:S1/P1 nuclease [Agaribacterium haliotis]|uniref:S1/P1 nuclease n=1 Tax=Agaribacterium haliotis TaxID=2013869 RepID=UPI000BB533C4|nr:S1/P1 nuclease [Agaribacterium haliotis]
MSSLSRIFICLFLLLSADLWAWSRDVHKNIADAAFVRLPAEAQAYYFKLMHYAPDDSMYFSDLSPWVDSVRKQPIAELYASYQAEVPLALMPVARSHSTRWHWSNASVYRQRGAEQCSFRNAGQLETVYPALEKALQEPLSPQAELLTLAFMMHLLEDAHQPLHTMTMLRKNCQSDRGGNDFCLIKQAGFCSMNLHSYWDSGQSVARNKTFWKNLNLEPASELPLQMQFNLVLSESQREKNKVYNTDENRMPHPNYQSWADTFSRERLTKAVSRLNALLLAHWRDKHI